MRKTPNHLIPRSDRDILGDDNSNNSFSSTNVVANADGSLIERLEYVQTCVGGLSGQLRFQQSASNVVEDDSYANFEITLVDINSGAITSANIDITSIAVELAKSTGGGAFSAVGITQPTFSKADGRVYTSNRFLAAEWSVGDTYRLTVSGITVAFGTETAYVPAMVWSNLITDIIDIDTIVDDIKVDTDRLHDTAVTVGMTAGSFASYIAGNNGGLGTQLPASSSLYDTTKNVNTVGVTSAPVANTLADTLHKDGSFTYDNTTDSLEAISDAVSTATDDVKYLYATADGGTIYPTKVLDNSILSILMTKQSGGDTSDFDNSTDSLEAIADAIASGSTDVTATSNGTTTTIVASGLTQGDDYWNGCVIISLSPTNPGQARIVTDFDDATDTLTVYPAFSAATNSGDTFSMISGMSLYENIKNLSTIGITSAPVANTLADTLHKDGSFTYDNTTDSLEAISDKVTEVNIDLGNFSGQTNLQSALAVLGVPDVAGKDLYTCLITDRLDNATYGLSAIETLVDDVETELAKVPKSDSNVTWNATALGSINAEVDTALNTIVPAAPTAGSLNDILSKASGGNTFDKATDSLEAIADAVASGSYAVTASAGSTTTITDTAFTQVDDYWNGCLMVALTGTNAGQARVVTDFDAGTDTFTVSPAFTGAVVNTDTFALISGYHLYEDVKNISSIGITAAPVASTLADTLHKDGSFTYDNTTDSLEAISDKIDAGFALTGDAVVGEVLDGKFFYKDNYQTKLEGTMPNNAGDVASVSAHMDAGTVLHVVPAEGYTDGSDDATTVDLAVVDADLATGNIKSGVTILGVAGAATVRDVSDWTDAVEADVASGKKFYKADGSQATGTA